MLTFAESHPTNATKAFAPKSYATGVTMRTLRQQVSEDIDFPRKHGD